MTNILVKMMLMRMMVMMVLMMTVMALMVMMMILTVRGDKEIQSLYRPIMGCSFLLQLLVNPSLQGLRKETDLNLALER